MDKLTTAIGDYQSFLQTIIKKTENAGFDMADFSQCDHMGYRTISLEQFEDKKRELSKLCNMLGENIVNDRPIATFRLVRPIISGEWRIDALELLAPRPGNPKPEGLDHVEFVLLDDLQTFLKKYDDKDFNLDAADRGVNPEIKLSLGDGQAVKFHLLNLPTVVYIEKKLGITSVK